MLSRLSEHLELSEQQRSQVRDILAQNGDQVRVDRERLQALRNALEEQRTDFDAGEAQRLADELGEITSRMAFGMTSKQAQIYAVLTDEQRAEFARLHAERDSRVHRRIGKHRE
jgi:Spy/CpxP family protein refolding chaperone